MRRALEQLQPDIAGDVSLRLDHERVERIPERAEPQAVVDHLRPLLRDQVLETRHLFRQRDVFECLMSLQQQHGGGRLVDFARLDADQPVLEVVDAADPVLAPHLVQRRHQVQRSDRLAVKRNRQTLFEADLYIGRIIGTLPRVARPRIDLGGRLRPRILEHAGFDRAAPQVLVGRVRGTDGGRDLDAVLVGVLDLVVPIHTPLAHRRDHLELRRERGCGDVESHLVVALAGAAMSDRAGAFAARDLDHHRRDQGPAQRGRERVLLFIYGARLERGPHEQLEKWDAAVGDVGCRSADLQRPRLDGVEVLLLAEVDGERNDVPALVLEPADRHRRVETARVGEDELLIRHGPGGL